MRHCGPSGKAAAAEKYRSGRPRESGDERGPAKRCAFHKNWKLARE
jgi:hypothetical protein